MQTLVLSFPPFRLDVADERLWKDGTEIKLRRKPFAILKYLATHPRRLVTQEELVGRDARPRSARAAYPAAPWASRHAANALQNARLVPTFTRTAELARRLGDAASLGAALVGLQQCRMLRGDVREIDAHAAEVSEVADRVGDPEVANWGRLMCWSGCYSC